MAKKSVWDNILGIFSSGMFDILFSTIKTQVTDLTQDLLKTVETHAKKLGAMFAHFIVVLFIALMGLLFFLISLVLMTADYFNLSLGQGLFIWAIILLIISFLYAQVLQKEKS